MTCILFVEDEAPIRDLVRFVLARAGMEMIEAADTEAARRLLEQRRPDLILLDWMLPQESGVHFLKALRKDPQRREIPVIMLTAMADEERKVQGLETGADDYVTKPFSPAELTARIKAVLRRATGRDADGLLRHGALWLDPDRHRVGHGDHRIHLRPTEYRLLAYLMSRPGRVFSRARLLLDVWGDDQLRDERAVDASIRRLRKALAPWGADRLVETVRGAGYRLAEPPHA